MKKVYLLVCTLLLITTLYGQRDFSKVEVKAEKLTENIYMLTGSGGNIGVLTGEDGVIMIDDQYAPLSEKIAAAIAEISDQPIRYVINTHWHGDHSGGNENFAKKGAVIVAHKNVRKRMSTKQLMRAFSREVPPSPEAAWPVITFEHDVALHLNGEDLMLRHIHNAHTDGDALVYFATSNVIHMGDTYFKGRFPFIDISSGGTITGMIKTINEALFIIDDNTQVIPGHGTMSNKKELTTYHDMLQTIYDRVKKAQESGKTLEELQAMNLTEGYEDWGTGFINAERFVDFIYSDLTKGEK